MQRKINRSPSFALSRFLSDFVSSGDGLPNLYARALGGTTKKVQLLKILAAVKSTRLWPITLAYSVVWCGLLVLVN